MATVRIFNEGPETIVIAQRIHDASAEIVYPQVFLNPGESADYPVSVARNLHINQITINNNLQMVDGVVEEAEAVVVDDGGILTDPIGIGGVGLPIGGIGGTPTPTPTPNIISTVTAKVENKLYLWKSGRLTVKDTDNG
jgi:hypothetical protein